MIGIPVGWLYANATEWVAHRYLLHGRGKRKDSFWHFHWGEHHGRVRKNAHVDPAYEANVWSSWNAQSKEVAALAVGVLVHLPLAPVAPFFFGTLVNRAHHYYKVHKRSHLDAAWAKEHLAWHVDHHMGKDQDANWCVTHPFFDILMGTRKPYLGTAAERRDQAKRRRRAMKTAA